MNILQGRGPLQSSKLFMVFHTSCSDAYMYICMDVYVQVCIFSMEKLNYTNSGPLHITIFATCNAVLWYRGMHLGEGNVFGEGGIPAASPSMKACICLCHRQYHHSHQPCTYIQGNGFGEGEEEGRRESQGLPPNYKTPSYIVSSCSH